MYILRPKQSKAKLRKNKLRNLNGTIKQLLDSVPQIMLLCQMSFPSKTVIMYVETSQVNHLPRWIKWRSACSTTTQYNHTTEQGTRFFRTLFARRLLALTVWLSTVSFLCPMKVAPHRQISKLKTKTFSVAVRLVLHEGTTFYCSWQCVC